MDLQKAKQFLDQVKICPDIDHLEREWIYQPELRLSVGTMLAEAKRDLQMAKSELELLECDLDRKVRSSPENYGLDKKVTEGAIRACVVGVEEYQQAKQKVIDLQYIVDLLEACVWAVDHRRRALEDLVQLRLSHVVPKM